jgi:hypothetical protein
MAFRRRAVARLRLAGSTLSPLTRAHQRFTRVQLLPETGFGGRARKLDLNRRIRPVDGPIVEVPGITRAALGASWLARR